MAKERRNRTVQSGITHFPLEAEQDSQEKVHENAGARGKGSSNTSRKGNPVSDRTNRPPARSPASRSEGGKAKGAGRLDRTDSSWIGWAESSLA